MFDRLPVLSPPPQIPPPGSEVTPALAAGGAEVRLFFSGGPRATSGVTSLSRRNSRFPVK